MFFPAQDCPTSPIRLGVFFVIIRSYKFDNRLKKIRKQRRRLRISQAAGKNSKAARFFAIPNRNCISRPLKTVVFRGCC